MITDEDISALSGALRTIAHAVTPLDALPYKDDSGGITGSLTEAAIGIAKSLDGIGNALERVAQAIEDKP